MASVVCPGCHVSFTCSSWSNHLSQTTKPSCRAIYSDQHSYVPGLNNSGLNGVSGEDCDTPEYNLLDSGSGNNENEDDKYAKYNGYGSHEENNIYYPPSPLTSSLDDTSQIDLDDPMDDKHGRLLTPSERKQLEDEAWVKPVVQVYPGDEAGKTYSSETYSTYLDYERELGMDANGNNPYTPFSSKVDWEFA